MSARSRERPLVVRRRIVRRPAYGQIAPLSAFQLTCGGSQLRDGASTWRPSIAAEQRGSAGPWQGLGREARAAAGTPTSERTAAAVASGRLFFWL